MYFIIHVVGLNLTWILDYRSSINRLTFSITPIHIVVYDNQLNRPCGSMYAYHIEILFHKTGAGLNKMHIVCHA